ncbi:MAG: S8 family serine peptidase [Candidatus Marinimicrobia bacterium]|nr:S8 family serine peptidase [Candidatus Neomarinimicrobiota bacterium]
MNNPIYKSLLVLLIPGILFSKSIEGTSMAKLSPELQNVIGKRSSKDIQLVDTPLSRARTVKGPSEEVLYPVTIRSTDIEAVKAAGIQTNSDYPGFSTARLTREQLLQLSEIDAVTSVFQGDILYPLNDLAVGLSGADLVQDGYLGGTAYEGTGVIVLVIDTGIDWTHLDFRDPDTPTTSRILYIWDQTLDSTGAEQTPAGRAGSDFAGLHYGVEYTKTHIENEFASSPGFVRTKDTNGHGTEVTGAAAGNGASALNGKYKGLAPKADIIVVRAGADSFENNNVIDALTYAKEIAADLEKPVVVNLSLGSQTNAHDGTSTLDAAVNTFTSNGTAAGRVAVVAAGNAGNENIHVTGVVADGSTENIYIEIPDNTAASGNQFKLELWWDSGDNATITLVSPGSTYSKTKTSGTDAGGWQAIGDNLVDMNNIITTDHSNGDRMTELLVADWNADIYAGTWTLQLTNDTTTPASTSDMIYHAWLHYDSNMGATISDGDAGDHNYTIASPGSASSAITVGAYASRWRWKVTGGYVTLGVAGVDEPDGTDDHAYFSSFGPTRTLGVQKPDIMTHGQGVITTTSKDYTPTAAFEIVADKYHVEQGTSVAAGSVSGAVALLLEHTSSLSAASVKTLLYENADTDTYTGTVPNTEWGYGKLNIFEALAAAGGSTSLNHKTLSYDVWDVDTAAYQGFGNTVKEAVKFSTGEAGAGDVTGAFFYPHKTVPSSDSISFEIWSDASGIPGTKVGSTVKLPCADIAKFTWNYVSLTAAGVSVAATTNFHLVLDNTSGGDFTLVKAVTNISNRSSKDQGPGWVAITEHDFRMRAVVSNKAAVSSPTLPLADNSLPVELSFFNASTVKGQMVLKWATESETENLGFMLERRKSGTDDWTFISDHTKDKGLQGQGSTSSRTDYIYYDKTAKPGVKYDYRLTDIPYTSAYTPTSIVLEDIEFRIAKFALHKNFPNPFNPATTISYELADDSDVQVKIFDVNGREVQSWDHNSQEAGYHEMVWAGVNQSGRPVSAGLYLLSVQAGNNLQTRKLLLLK